MINLNSEEGLLIESEKINSYMELVVDKQSFTGTVLVAQNDTLQVKRA